MGKIILISGPTKSGKTHLAEKMAKASGLDEITYLATQARAFMDEGMKHRIQEHQKQRPSHWSTLESYLNIPDQLPKESNQGLIFDCVTVWATNVFFHHLPDYTQLSADTDWDEYVENFQQKDIAYFQDYLLDEMKKILEEMKASQACFWIVSNELGWSVSATTKLGNLFVDYIGRLNQEIAQEADEVYLTVMGLPQRLK